VKNLHGVLSGDEESYDWLQTKSSSGGEFYQKTIKNPIKQVKRQIYILSGLLKRKNLDTWIEGYVFFVERNCPIKSDLVLETRKDIDLAIHTNGKQTLSKKKQSAIIKLLLK
ncbi:MAG: NERD domain-containing protein, partial [Lachnospiraceae bacterium]|nr:NERD domain-containing protein [Lachnospiraceae bacterium]